MKDTVLTFLRHLPAKREDRFNQAFALLRKTPGANQALISSYNMLGATESNINNILYDLKKYNGITEVMIRATPKVTKTIVLDQTDPSSQTLVPTTEEEKKKTSLREQFPFLNDKDCPNELHIVTGLLIASYGRYQEHMSKINQFKAKEIELTEAEDLALTEAAQAEFMNNEALFRELEHYKEHKALLAEHPALKEHKWTQQYKEMDMATKVNYKKNAESYYSKNNKVLEKPEVPQERKEQILKNFEERKFIVGLIDKELNVSK